VDSSVESLEVNKQLIQELAYTKPEDRRRELGGSESSNDQEEYHKGETRFKMEVKPIRYRKLS
jgi:hypothetical protein